MSKDIIKWEGYLAIAVNKRYPDRVTSWTTTAKLYAKKPSVGRDEVAVKIAVDLPASLFLRPQLEARISVPETAVTPLVVDLETQDNIAELLSQQLGFDVRIIAEPRP